MMNKKSITRGSKVLLVLQLIILVGALSFVYFFKPELDYPDDKGIIEGEVVDFKFRNAKVVLIDENPDFNSPRKINLKEIETTRFRFNSGTYYWKVLGVFESEVRSFTINSKVGLKLDNKNSSVRNIGTVPVNLSREDESRISGLAILDVSVDHPVDVSEKVNYRGEQYES